MTALNAIAAWLFVVMVLCLIASFVPRLRGPMARSVPISRVRLGCALLAFVSLLVCGATAPPDTTAPSGAPPTLAPATNAAVKSAEKIKPAMTTPQQPGDRKETLRAAVLFCIGFKPLLQPGETVEDAESMVSPQPCGLPNGTSGYCPNGFRTGPSGDIAEKFGISWEKANADIVAGLRSFASNSRIADACARLEEADAADMTPVLQAQQRTLDARLALCAAAADEYQDVLEHSPHKDAIILANQFAIGERAGGAVIGHEWFAYKDGAWHDSDCYALSTAPWAMEQGYGGDPIRLPSGAIGIVVGSGG